MKQLTKIICLLAAVALMFACFAGCGDDNASSAVASGNKVDLSSMSETDKIQNINDNYLPDYDLGGAVLKVASGHTSVLFPDEENTELEARRKEWIDECKTKYNFELEDVYYAWDSMTTNLMTDLISGEYVADFVLPVIRQAGPFVQNKQCYDLTSGEFAQYLDFSMPWWDQTMLKASTINGKTYCCTPQFTSAANTTWVCFFNRNLMEELGYNPDDMYTLQETGKWTWDKFIEMGKKAVKDLDANGAMDANDRFAFGTAKWHAFNNLLTAAGVDYIVETEGKFKFNLNTPRAISVISKINEMFTGYGMYFDVETGGDSLYNMFANDRLLFALTAVATCSNPTIRDMESDFGMVLTPKYEEGMEYISRAEQTTLCCFVPVTAQYKLETAFAVQALSYRFWKGVEDIMELNFAQYVRDDGSEYCIYEVFNHTTFTIDQFLFDVTNGEKPWYQYILDTICVPVVTKTNPGIDTAILSIEQACQDVIDYFYEKHTTA